MVQPGGTTALKWALIVATGFPVPQDCGVTATSLPVKETVRVQIPASRPFQFGWAEVDQFLASAFSGSENPAEAFAGELKPNAAEPKPHVPHWDHPIQIE